MPFAQYIQFTIDKAVEMLMDNHTSKTEVALFLIGFRDNVINNKGKGIVDVDFKEIEMREIEEREMI